MFDAEVVILGMKLKASILALVIFAFISFGYAQENTASQKINVSVPEVALLGLVSETQTDVNLNAIAPDEAGSEVKITRQTKGSVWVNYSSVLSKSAKKRKVIAMVQGEIPEGVVLKVEASEYSGSGKGRLGKSTGVVTLSNQPSDVIVDIGSCFTGTGVNNGHCLTYNMEQDISSDNFALLSQAQKSVNVVYTLTDYN
ncbi:hypothetical protein [uncultured Draconibacterium sp.]|uniref:hypothetical protein n=1 Tax=uncultured Draconibacterium sp. TaxID=1573823 RepID=UPI0032180372